MRRACIAFILWMTALGLPGQSAGPLTERDIAVLTGSTEAIFRLDYGAAFAMAADAARVDPEDPLPDVIRARTLWQQEMTRTGAIELARFAAEDFFVEKLDSKHRIDPDPAAEADFHATTDRAIEKALAQLSQSPRDARLRFLLGMAHRAKATYHATFRGGWWSAFRAGDAARKAHQVVAEAYPDFADAQLSLGVYDYVAGSVHWFHRLCGRLLGIRGNRQRGLRVLERVAAESLFSRQDAQVMLVLLYTREGRYRDAFPLLAQLRRQYPRNCRVPLDEATLMLYMNQPEDAIALYEGSLKEARREPREGVCPSAVLLQTRIGVAHHLAGRLPSARDTLREAMTGAGSLAERLRARLELAKVLDLMDLREEAVLHYAMVAKESPRAADRDEAARYRNQPYREGPHMLARKPARAPAREARP